MSSTKITKEINLSAADAPPIDLSVFKPTKAELEFLRRVISQDDDELKQKVLKAQEETYAVYPYPCILRFHFTMLYMSVNRVYPKVLEEGRKGNSIFLDLGCCMGTDLRKLALDGFPANNLLGCDLRQGFIDAGYRLYQDKDSYQITFFTSNIFDLSTTQDLPVQTGTVPFPEVKSLEHLKGRLNYVYTGALFHLFDEDTQYALAYRLLLLVDLTQPAVIFGRHQGLPKAQYIEDHLARVRYGHSPKSWPQMWKKVITELKGEDFAENNVSVEAYFDGEQTRFMFWSVSINA